MTTMTTTTIETLQRSIIHSIDDVVVDSFNDAVDTTTICGSTTTVVKTSKKQKKKTSTKMLQQTINVKDDVMDIFDDAVTTFARR